MNHTASKLSANQWQYLQDLMRQRVGQELPNTRRSYAEFRLSVVLQGSGLASLDQLFAAAMTTPSIMERIIDSLLVDETYFFRDPNYFTAVRERLLPQLFRARKEQRNLRIWSAACSTGQEAYSLSILLRQYFQGFPGWDIEVWASDASEHKLEYARRGKYQEHEVQRGLTPEQISRYFEANERTFSVREEARTNVVFRRLNLVDQPWPSTMPNFDLVFLRHVLVYMNEEMRRRVLTNVRKQLRSGGFLMLGGSEAAMPVPAPFTRVTDLVDTVVAYQFT